MSDNVRDQVEDLHAHEEVRTARSLSEAANSGQSLQGYAAINGLQNDPEATIDGTQSDTDIAALAYEYFQKRNQFGTEGSADNDWLRAEAEIRRRRTALNA